MISVYKELQRADFSSPLFRDCIMYRYKLTRMVLNDGTNVKLNDLTVIVGPNNVGKSRALRDISEQTTMADPPNGVIITNVDWSLPQTLHELRQAYPVERRRNEVNNWVGRTLQPSLCSEYLVSGGGDWPSAYEHLLPANGQKEFAGTFGPWMIAHLTTENRLQLVKNSPSGESELQEANLLQALYNAGSDAEALLRDQIKQVFAQEVVLDFTNLRQLFLRVGKDFSSVPKDPRDAKSMLATADKLDDQGDGIRSFVGIMTSLIAVKRSVFLIDEPEAFLHPPQAFRIGQLIADQAKTTHQIIVATHSADFLRGVLSSTQDVTVLRIDRENTSSSFRLLPAEKLKEIVADALLSSARVFEGMFYYGAIVVEGDRDARFYQSLSNKQRPGIDLHFVNAGSKQTVSRIVSLYKQMGLRCAGIVDFDVLNNKEEFRQQLATLGSIERSQTLALEIRDEIAAAVKEARPDDRIRDVQNQVEKLQALITSRETSGTDSEKERVLRNIGSLCQEIAAATKAWKNVKQQGCAMLDQDVRNRFYELYNLCSSEGLFINPKGELESMLSDYGIAHTTAKKEWFTQALSLVPELEVNDAKQPWAFINDLHQQLVIPR
jgi:predicted ATPase